MEKLEAPLSRALSTLSVPGTSESRPTREDKVVPVAPVGIRPRFRSCSFEGYQCEYMRQRSIVDKLKEYAEAFTKQSRSLIFLGTIGTGKGHLSSAICHAVGARGFSSVFVKCHELIQAIKHSWGKEDEKETMDLFQRTDLLIIDEVTVQLATETDKLILYDVIDYRYEYRRPTIVVANCDFGQLKACLNARIVDRLQDDGGEIFVFDWTSYRSKQKGA